MQHSLDFAQISAVSLSSLTESISIHRRLDLDFRKTQPQKCKLSLGLPYHLPPCYTSLLTHQPNLREGAQGTKLVVH